MVGTDQLPNLIPDFVRASHKQQYPRHQLTVFSNRIVQCNSQLSFCMLPFFLAKLWAVRGAHCHFTGCSVAVLTGRSIQNRVGSGENVQTS